MEAINDRTFQEQFAIIGNLVKADLNTPFIIGNQARNKPADLQTEQVIYPYYSYNIVSYRKVQHITKRFSIDNGVQNVYYDQFDITCSITAVGMGIFATMEAVERINSWLKEIGKKKLSINGIPVVSIGTITQRDFFMGNEHERRHGFDVVFRMARENEEIINYIETVEVQNETQ